MGVRTLLPLGVDTRATVLSDIRALAHGPIRIQGDHAGGPSPIVRDHRVPSVMRHGHMAGPGAPRLHASTDGEAGALE